MYIYIYIYTYVFICTHTGNTVAGSWRALTHRCCEPLVLTARFTDFKACPLNAPRWLGERYKSAENRPPLTALDRGWWHHSDAATLLESMRKGNQSRRNRQAGSQPGSRLAQGGACNPRRIGHGRPDQPRGI